MTALRKSCLIASILLVAGAAVARGDQLREHPELVQLWPFGHQYFSLPVVHETPKTAKPDKKRRLVAPFVRSKININTCTLVQLQALPGVTPSMGAHILAGRPYRNFDDLERDGVPTNVVSGLRSVVTFGPRP